MPELDLTFCTQDSFETTKLTEKGWSQLVALEISVIRVLLVEYDSAGPADNFKAKAAVGCKSLLSVRLQALLKLGSTKECWEATVEAGSKVRDASAVANHVVAALHSIQEVAQQISVNAATFQIQEALTSEFHTRLKDAKLAQGEAESMPGSAAGSAFDSLNNALQSITTYIEQFVSSEVAKAVAVGPCDKVAIIAVLKGKCGNVLNQHLPEASGFRTFHVSICCLCSTAIVGCALV